MVTRKYTKAARQHPKSVVAAPQQTPEPQAPAPILPTDRLYPRFQATLKAELDKMGFKAATEAKLKRKSTVTLSEARARALGFDANDLASKFAAIQRLSIAAEDGGMDMQQAATQGIEAMAILGALQADALAHAIGGMRTGFFEDEVRKLAGPLEREASHA